MTEHRIGTQEEWQAERDELLKEEKELTRRGDELARKRRELPWVPVEKDYRFETEDGPKTLADLFDCCSQLLVYHFMFGPPWEAGCPVCSSIADTLQPQVVHLKAREHTEEELKAFLEGETRPPSSKTRACAGRTWWGTSPLDRAPKGRAEDDSRPLWVRRHDEYEAAQIIPLGLSSPAGRYAAMP